MRLCSKALNADVSLKPCPEYTDFIVTLPIELVEEAENSINGAESVLQLPASVRQGLAYAIVDDQQVIQATLAMRLQNSHLKPERVLQLQA